MRGLRAVSLGVAGLALFVSGRVVAQNPPRGGRVGVVYDRATVGTMSGEITEVSLTPSPRNLGGGLHVSLKVGSQLFDVHLAPQWYLNSGSLNLAPGDRIEVSGSRLAYEGNLVFIAARITRGPKALVLRDSMGAPVWQGPRPKGEPPRMMR